MGKFENLIGQKCKSWIVVSRAEDSFDPSGRKRIRWLCKCENCGAEKNINEPNDKKWSSKRM